MKLLSFLFVSFWGTLQNCLEPFVSAEISGVLSIIKFQTTMDENCLYEVSKGVVLQAQNKNKTENLNETEYKHLELYEVSDEDEIFRCSYSMPFTENCGSMVDFGFTFEFTPSGSGRFTWHHISNACPMTHSSFIFERAISICHSDNQLVLALERMVDDKTFEKEILLLFTSFHNQQRVGYSFDHLRNATKGNQELQHLDPILCVDFNHTLSVMLEKGIREIGDEEGRLLGRSMTSGFVDIFFDGRGNMDGVSEWSNVSKLKHKISKKIKLALISTALAVCILSAGYASSWWYRKKSYGRPQPKLDLKEPLLDLNFQNEKHDSLLIDQFDSKQNQHHQECKSLSPKNDDETLLKYQYEQSKSCSEFEDEKKIDVDGKSQTKRSSDDRKTMFPGCNQNIDLL